MAKLPTPKPTPPAAPKPATKAVPAKSASRANLSLKEQAILDEAHKAGVSPEATATTMAALANAPRETTAKPAPGKFFLPGFNLVLPIEAQFGFNLLVRELSAIPPKYFAANERQSLNAALKALACDVAKVGVTPATSASCKKLIADIRHQAKACAARAHQADIKTDSAIRLQEAERKARAEKRAASRATEYKGDGTPGDLDKVNALPVSVEPVIEKPKPGPKTRRALRRQRKIDALQADRPWEEE